MAYKYFYHQRDRFWTRIEDQDITSHVHVVDNLDTSPEWPKWNIDQYNPDCASCWLNIPHSTQYHQDNLHH